MKQLLIILTLLSVFIRAGAQNIAGAEYFIDADPGIGKGATIPLSPANDVTNVTFSPSIASIAAGFHRVYVRTKDNSGRWSLANSLIFYKNAPETTGLLNVVSAEYYFDTDPGVGAGVSIPVSPASNAVGVSFSTSVSGLAPGFHRLYVRTLDSRGKWSLTQSLIVFKQPVQQVVTPKLAAAEFYFDNDPGQGLGNPINVTPNETLVDVNFTASAANLSSGFHRLYVRTRDDNGRWSLTQSLIVYKPEPVTISNARIFAAEYFIDNDPGQGNATSVAVTPTQDASSLVITPSVAGMAPGFHRIYVRTKDENGRWSLTQSQLFYKQDPAMADALLQQIEYFIDTDPGFGKGVPVVVNTTTKIADSVFTVNTTGLVAGAHKFYLRTKDSRGAWSLTNIVSFNVGTVPSGSAIVVNKVINRPTCSGDSLKLSFHKTGLFNSGNVFKAEISDASGSFGSPVTIGVITDTASSIISCKLPAHLSTSNRYRIRVSSTNPAVTGLTSVDSFRINNRPLPTIISGPSDVNAGFNNLYSAEAIAGSSYSWIVASATFTTSANTATVKWATAGMSQLIKVYETDAYGCKGDTGTKSVNVYSLRIDSVKISSLTPCPSSIVTINAKATGVYDSTNTFTVQLSNATGSFASPISFGSVKSGTVGSLKAVAFSAKLPFAIANGTGYRIRVIASAPAVTSSDNGQNITIDRPNVGLDKTITKCPSDAINLNTLYNTANLTVKWNTLRPDSVVNPGTYQLIVTNGYGCKDTAGVKITNYVKPYIGRDTTVTICEGTTRSIRDLYNTTGYTTSFSTTDPDNVAAGSYTLIVTNANGCKDTAVITVAANPKPRIGNDTTISICEGSTANISAIYPLGSYASVVWTTTTPESVSAGTYSLIVINSFGCRDTAVITVVTNPKPNIGNDTTVYVCQGSARSIVNVFNLDDGTAVWNTTNPASVAEGVYSVVFTNTFGCKDTASVTVIGNPKPYLGADTTLLICAGSFTNLNGIYNTTGYESVQWSTGRPDSVKAGTYTLYAVKNSGCSDTAVVTVNERPTLAPVIAYATPVAFCKNDSVVLSVTGGQFTSYGWSNAAVTPTVTIKVGGSYKVTVTDVNGCSKTSAPVNVTVNPLPATPVVTTNPTSITNLCPGTVVTLSSSSAMKYLWMTGDTASSITVTTPDSYIVKVFNSYGCSAKSAAKKVTYAACGAPASVATTGVSDNSAVAFWKRVPCATSYELQYRKYGTTTFVTVPLNDTLYNFGNLFPGTKYEWNVRSVCSVRPITTSANSATIFFTTTGSPVVFRPKAVEETKAGQSVKWDPSVYPNPAAAIATLKINGNIKDYTVTISNSEGKVLWVSSRMSSSTVSLPVQNLPSGMYLVTVKDDSEIKTTRLLVQK